MKANSLKQRCLALRYVLLECFALLVMEWSADIASDPTRGSRHDFSSGRPGRT